MKDKSDAIVVGGGPCGSFAALKLAERGLDVSIFEEHSKIGVPSHCAGHLGVEGLKILGLYPLPEAIVENTIFGAVFYSPHCNNFAIRFPSPVTCVVDRVLFDNYIAKKAKAFGASYYLNSRVESLIIDEGTVKGTVVRQKGRIERKLAKIVVDAEGVSSRISQEAGLSGFDRSKIVSAVEAEVENVENVEKNMVEVFLGKDYAPGFYAWLIPKKDGKAKIGLASKTGKTEELLKKLMLRHPIASRKLAKAKISQIMFHPITLAGPPSKTYSNGFLTVGDAASQVKPTTGGGVVFGMTCAWIAAQVVHQGLLKNDLSSEFLCEYQRRCNKVFGFEVRFMLKMRKTLDSMSNDKLDNVIGFCSTIGLDKTLQSVRNLDFQGQTILRNLRKPRLLAALGYFFLTYLFANL
jgi:geranylgeranyl reductase family protein